jgi:protein-disulfide isomerase
LTRMRLLASLLAAALSAGCHAQSVPVQSHDARLDRHIQAMVRSQFNVTQDYDVTLGARTSSTTAGFDTLPITLSHGGKTTVINFLISTDGKTLARMESFDLANDPAFSIGVAGRPVRGNAEAKVTVVNFDDLECPVCARVHQELFPAALERYKDKVRFIYKDNPLLELHPWAMHAAVDANCVAAQSGETYWKYVDYLHSHGQEVSGPDRNPQRSFAALDRIAREQAVAAKLDQTQLDACLAKQDEAPVRASMKEAAAMGLNFTPAIFVNGERISGWIPEEQIWRVVDRALRDAGVEPPAAPAQPVQKAGPGN